MYTTHPQTVHLIVNSKLKRQKRLARLIFILLFAFAVVFAFTRYNASQAQAIKAQAISTASQVNRLAMIKANTASDKATATLDRIKALTANYSNQ